MYSQRSSHATCARGHQKVKDNDSALDREEQRPYLKQLMWTVCIDIRCCAHVDSDWAGGTDRCGTSSGVELHGRRPLDVGIMFGRNFGEAELVVVLHGTCESAGLLPQWNFVLQPFDKTSSNVQSILAHFRNRQHSNK